jgi:hypothetical protein
VQSAWQLGNTAKAERRRAKVRSRQGAPWLCNAVARRDNAMRPDMGLIRQAQSPNLKFLILRLQSRSAPSRRRRSQCQNPSSRANSRTGAPPAAIGLGSCTVRPFSSCSKEPQLPDSAGNPGNNNHCCARERGGVATKSTGGTDLVGTCTR